jgi:NAD(P)-dependent dehydrogenase (short-subunit alcohol dehydrogenase family)
LAAYGASKAALLFLTKVLARDWARYGIRVNSISPGLIQTAATKVLTDRDDLVAKEMAMIPLARLGVPVDLGGAAVFLGSDASSYVTGVDIPVDGGALVY